MKINPTIEPTWHSALRKTFDQNFFIDLKLFLIDEYKNYVVYPKKSELFAAFNKTPFDQVKVVILGQDPYHGENQAHGLCFSVKEGNKIPPSLNNIFKELKSDLDIDRPKNGNLTPWAEQGVFLLNTTLSVRAKTPLSHQKKGWERFTNAAIEALSKKKRGIIFLLWGGHAQTKENLIDATKNFILKAPHPSPLSAHRGFLGCKHFSKTNTILESNGLTAIDWKIN